MEAEQACTPAILSTEEMEGESDRDEEKCQPSEKVREEKRQGQRSEKQEKVKENSTNPFV